MIYLPEQKLLFIHIYKTGGMSIKTALAGALRPLNIFTTHPTPAEIRAVLKDYDKCFKFAVVRNSWDWQVSLYHYILQAEQLGHERHREFDRVQGYGSFREYILQGVRNGELSETRRQQAEWCFDDLGQPIDFVARFESLQADWEKICRTNGLPARELPRINASHHRPYRDYYDNQTRQIVASRFRRDIELFNFSF